MAYLGLCKSAGEHLHVSAKAETKKTKANRENKSFSAEKPISSRTVTEIFFVTPQPSADQFTSMKQQKHYREKGF